MIAAVVEATVVVIEVTDCDTNPTGMLLMAGFCFGGTGFLLIGLKRVTEDQPAGRIVLAGLEEVEPAAAPSSTVGFLTGVSPSLLGGGRSPYSDIIGSLLFLVI